MVNDLLRQNGIRSAVQGSSDAFSALQAVMAPGNIVLVDERDFDKANELYTSFFGDDSTPLTGGGVDEDEGEYEDDDD
jgi:hypothetical protein